MYNLLLTKFTRRFKSRLIPSVTILVNKFFIVLVNYMINLLLKYWYFELSHNLSESSPYSNLMFLNTITSLLSDIISKMDFTNESENCLIFLIKLKNRKLISFSFKNTGFARKRYLNMRFESIFGKWLPRKSETNLL